MCEKIIKSWELPEIWKNELISLILSFKKNNPEEYSCVFEHLNKFLVTSKYFSRTRINKGQRVFLVSEFSSRNIDEIIEEALNYLFNTLVVGYADVIYPNWGDTPFDLLQKLAVMIDSKGNLFPKLPRNNKWPLRGYFSLKIKKRCFALGKLDCNVLITAPSGCGKEAIARIIHQSSTQTGKLISVSIPAIPPNLFYSVIFGYERGAYTGAERKHLGVFEKAHNGTLFLDEIADINKEQQAALLRALSERRATSIDGTREYEITCRIITATNRIDVLRETFRSDLLIRLAEQEVSWARDKEDWRPIRPLNTIREQIPLLFAMQFVRIFREQLGYDVAVPDYKLTLIEHPTLDQRSVLRYLSQIDWALNFRQLQQVCLSSLLRYITKLDCMKDILHDPQQLNSEIKKNILLIELKSMSRYDQNTSSAWDSDDAGDESLCNYLAYGDLSLNRKRWENIAIWVRRKVILYLLNKGLKEAEIARILEVDRSSISRFRKIFISDQGNGY
jgi:DNA-binding NtrC family response regulator